MALRLIEMVLLEKDCEGLRDLIKEHNVLEGRHVQLQNGEVLVRILLHAEHCEVVLDLLEKRYLGTAGSRLLILPVEATLPRDQQPEQPASVAQPAAEEKKSPDRIAREELYQDIEDAAHCSRVYLSMAVLSTVVATVGLHHNSVAIIIGAMVIAPLLGPNMALAFGTALGDLHLLRRAIVTLVAGIATATVLSLAIGALVHVDPTLSEVVSRTRVQIGDIVVALASGCAGALAFTKGGSATLIGVMVAVALLPPLATFGLLLGGGYPGAAMGALALFLINLICINLSGVTTFVVQGIRPAKWWEQERAKKATRLAIGVWVTLLAILVVLILLFRRGWM